jgi:hypothetical protein
MKKTRFGGFFFVWIICARRGAKSKTVRQYGKAPAQRPAQSGQAVQD